MAPPKKVFPQSVHSGVLPLLCLHMRLEFKGHGRYRPVLEFCSACEHPATVWRVVNVEGNIDLKSWFRVLIMHPFSPVSSPDHVVACCGKRPQSGKKWVNESIE